MTADIEVRELQVTYGDTAVLDGVGLTVASGEWTAIVGPNGAGKTTLLRAIAGLVPHGGTVRVDGAIMGQTQRRAAARLVAFVPQNPQVPAGMTVDDYVLLGRTPHLGYLEFERASDLAACSAVLGRLDLESFRRRRLDSLSGGELQRAVLARALAQEAPVLLLDEPTAALDIARVQDVLSLVDGLRRREGVTVVSAMHDLTAASQYADRVILLAGGRIVADGSPRDVLTPRTIEAHYGVEVSIVDQGDGIVVVPRRKSVVRGTA